MTDYIALSDFATDRQKEYINAIIAHGSHVKAAKFLGVDRRGIDRSMDSLKKKATKRGYSPEYGMTHPAPPGFGVKGTSTLYDAETGQPKIQWVKTQVDAEQMAEQAAAFMETFAADYKGQSKPVKPPKNINDDLLTIYPLGDPHFGMRAWKKETGIENFDTEIAARDLTTAIRLLVDAAPKSKVGVLCNMGDLFHSDNLSSTTQAGTPVDTDGRMSHTIDVAARVFRLAIDLMLTKHKEVRLMNVRGNHDAYSSLFFNKLMAAYYENDPRVTVMPNENKVQIITWGDVFLNFIHGDKINNRKWHEMITRDFAAEWGRAKHRYGHKGHIHHWTVEELGGIPLESHPTLAPPDAWHAASGYGAGRSTRIITYHKDFGEYQRNPISIEMIRAAQANQ